MYRELKEVDLLKTDCDIPPYLSVMADSLNSQQEEISELKAVLQEEDDVKILLSNITTEMDSLNEVIQATENGEPGGSREMPGAIKEAILESWHTKDIGDPYSQQKRLTPIRRRQWSNSFCRAPPIQPRVSCQSDRLRHFHKG